MGSGRSILERQLPRRLAGWLCQSSDLTSAKLAFSGRGFGVITQSVGHVDRSCSPLEDTKGPDDWRGHTVLRLIDLEVLQRPV